MMDWRTKMTAEPAKMGKNDGLAEENDRQTDKNGRK